MLWGKWLKKSLILGTLGEYLKVTFPSLFKPYKKRFLQEKEKKRKEKNYIQ